MSYANRKQMSSNRTAAIIIVALIHAVLGYALVTGLAYDVVKKAAEDLKTFDVEEEPPPPEEEPPPPEETPQETPPPPVAAPPPLVRTPVQESPVQATPNPPPVVPITPRATPAPPAPPAPPPPPPPVQRSEPKSAVGSLQGLFRSDDYPDSALDREEQGTVRVSLTIGTNGRVSGCSVSSSSGSSTLDRATCRIITSRARFTPAMDSNGNPTTGNFSQSITWRVQ
jgi:protein TonB